MCVSVGGGGGVKAARARGSRGGWGGGVGGVVVKKRTDETGAFLSQHRKVRPGHGTRPSFRCTARLVCS